jgi:hypothetical protein
MSCYSKSLSLLIATLFFLSGAVFAQTEEPVKGWPRSYESGGNKVIVYQPQLDVWQKHSTLLGKAAVVVELKGESKEYYGALDLKARTEVDFDSRTVLLDKLEITKYTFPIIDQSVAKRCRKAVASALPIGKSTTISLDRVLAGLEQAAEQAKAVAVNLEPPPIHYSDSPATLVMFMGEPKFEEVEGVAELLYAVNTNWDVLLEFGTSNYYLLHGQSWLTTKDIVNGPWRVVSTLPKAFFKLPTDDNWKTVKQSIPGKKNNSIPRIIISQRPAELIVTEGRPSYSPVAGTELLYVSNTDSDLFLHSESRKLYFLSAGRWFTAERLSGPWSAASENLPDEFNNIPLEHDKARVLSSVPGTSEAEAAVLLAAVPRKATVDRNTASVTVIYEDTPEFIVIKGTTSPVYYAINSPYSVFRVDNRYYAVHNGIWFVADSAHGPWLVCVSVPQVLYSIPANHPKHNVTYVYIYDTTPDTVVVGYTSGYSGTYVATTGVIMFGLGYWIGHDDYYNHYHHYHYHSHYYAYGSAARYDYYHGGYYHSARYYGPRGGASGWAGYDPGSGRYYRGGVASGPYGNAFAREAYNPYTNRYAAQAGAKTPYSSWGRTVVADGNDWARAGHRSQGGKTIAGIEGSKGGKAIGGYNKWTDRGAVVGKNKYGDVYVGRDGNVYKRNGDNWQKNSGKGWSNVGRSADRSSMQSRSDSARSKASANQRKLPDSPTLKTRPSSRGSKYSAQGSSLQRRSNNLNHEFTKRSLGNTRSSNYQQRSRNTRSRSSGGGLRRR